MKGVNMPKVAERIQIPGSSLILPEDSHAAHVERSRIAEQSASVRRQRAEREPKNLWRFLLAENVIPQDFDIKAFASAQGLSEVELSAVTSVEVTALSHQLCLALARVTPY